MATHATNLIDRFTATNHLTSQDLRNAEQDSQVALFIARYRAEQAYHTTEAYGIAAMLARRAIAPDREHHERRHDAAGIGMADAVARYVATPAGTLAQVRDKPRLLLRWRTALVGAHRAFALWCASQDDWASRIAIEMASFSKMKGGR
jgi:hypothetical protein